MRNLLRPGNLYILFNYLLLSLVPFSPKLIGGTIELSPRHILGMELLAWLVLWIVFKRPAWFHIFLLPAFFALPVEIYLQLLYQHGITPHHLGIMVETNPRVALEYLGNKVWLILLLVMLITCWWGSVWIAAWRTKALDLSLKMRAIILLLVVMVGIGSFQPEYTDEYAPPVDFDGKPATAYPFWRKIPYDLRGFGSSWPFGLAVIGYDFWLERQYLSQLANQNRVFKFGAHQVGSTATEPQTVVLVIGESSRYDRWSLDGYERETNPLLKKEKNLVMLSDMVSGATATRIAVPIIVSRKPTTDSLNDGFAEKSFLSAYKEAGFKTYWFSNQMSFGQFDTTVSVFAKEADVLQFVNLGDYTNASSLDDVLFDPFRRAMADSAPKKLIVLHLLVSHWNYSHRYPKQFDKWQPSLFGVDNPEITSITIKPQMNNSYDNSILYTDWLLSQVIGDLKKTQQISALMYLSDHGQVLYDGSCNIAFHGHHTQYEFHVPSFVWYSDQYQTAHPDKIASLFKNKDAKLSTENVFHTMLDLSDIRYSTEQLEHSVVSQKLAYYPRYVSGLESFVDYDHADFKGDCREVAAKTEKSK